MLKGIYTAAAGMLATQISTDTLASNLSNVNTIGFKANKVNFQTFPEMMINRVKDQEQQRVGSLMTGSKIFESYIDFSAGALRPTGNTFDLAIQGDGFFTVKSNTGETYYTRAGNFTMSPDGFLTNMNGDYVQGKLGNIPLGLDSGPFTINTRGEISGRNGVIDQLQVTRFENKHTLEKVTENLYRTTAASTMKPDPANGEQPDYKVNAGMLEESNINPVWELVNNIQGLRLYEALQKNIHVHNDTLGKAVNEVGRAR